MIDISRGREGDEQAVLDGGVNARPVIHYLNDDEWTFIERAYSQDAFAFHRLYGVLDQVGPDAY